MGIDQSIASVLTLFKGRDAELIKVLFQQWQILYDKQQEQVDKLTKKVEDLTIKINESIEREERCLQQNVRNNELVRNLVEYIIFEEGRDNKRRDLAMLLKK